MPSFENFVIGAPVGFSQGCISLNELAISDEAYFAQLVNNSLKKSDYLPKDAKDLQHKNEIKCLNYLVRSSRQATPVPTIPQIATILDTNSFLTRDCVEKLAVELQSFASNTDSDIKQITQVCQQYDSAVNKLNISLHHRLRAS